MKKNRLGYPLLITILVVTMSLFLSSCSTVGKAADPGDWGYDCLVTYQALGGVVNNREVRETYYMKNSYLFKPSGSTNMLIEPIRDGYVLAGWYTAKEDVLDEDGKVTGYSFKAEDRWDFNEDRVQEDMTLYARWIVQGQVKYVDPDTEEVKFSKNITGNDAIQPLSAAAEQLITIPGMTFDGYYADKDLTTPYPFNVYVHQELVPSLQEVYDALYEAFPQYMEKIEFEEPDEEEEAETETDTSQLFINRLGYALTTEDPDALAQIRQTKDQIYEDAIEHYQANTADKIIYLKYSEGRFITVSKASDLKRGGKLGFYDTDVSGNPIDGYIITSNIDFGGDTFDMVDSFSGKLVGNGFSLKNFRLTMKPKRMDQDKHKDLALFLELDGAEIENLSFEDVRMEINLRSGVSLNAAPLAITAKKASLKNVKLVNVSIDTGKGDDGEALYKLGDLFIQDSGSKLDQVTGEDIEFHASEFAEIHRLLD